MTSPSVIRVGDSVPPIFLIDQDGNAFDLEDLRGRPVVLILHRHLA